MLTPDRLRSIGYQLDKLAYPEIGALIKREREGQAIFFLPIGTFQPHGPHNPVGTDLLISMRMCQDACERLMERDLWPAVLPAIPYGVTTYFNEFPGCIALGGETLTSCIVDICRDLSRQGVHRLMVINNQYQPEHLHAIYRAIGVAKEQLEMRVHYMDITHPHKKRAAELPEAYHESDFHGGRYETSLMMASNPELVDEEVRETLPSVPIDLVEKVRIGQTSSAQMGVDRSYIGFPAEASAEEGNQAYANLLKMLMEAIESMLRSEEMPGPGWYARMADEA